MNNKVSVGVTSIIGWLTALLALLPTIIKSIESGVVAFSGPEKYLAIAGIASGLITNIARYLQAQKLIGNNPVNINEMNFERPPESAVKPDGPVVSAGGDVRG